MVAKRKSVRGKSGRSARTTKAAKCLTCNSKAQSRGLCWSCLRDAHAVIRNGQRSEQQLIDGGLILPSQRPGRKISSPFMDRLSQAH